MAFRRIIRMHPVFLMIMLCISAQHQVNTHQQITIKDLFKSQTGLVASVRVPRHAGAAQMPTQEDVVVRKARDSKYYSGEDKYRQGYKDEARGGGTLKQDGLAEDNQGVKSGAGLGKRCTTCETGYLRGRGGYDRNDRDPYASYYSRGRYDPYDSYGRDGYIDDYDRDYRGRTRYPYSSYDRYDPRERYYERSQGYDRGSGYDRGLGYDRGQGYDNRGYDYRERSNYIPYYRDRYDPLYDNFYNRDSGASGYDAYSGRGYYGRPDYYGGSGVYGGNGAYGGGYGGNGGYGGRYGGYGGGYGGGGGYTGGGGYGGNGIYAKEYTYGDRDRYLPNNGYGDSGYGYGNGGYGSSTYRSRYPTSNDYDSGYKYRSYLYERPSSTTVDPPKNADNEPSNTASPQQGSSSGRIQ